MTSMGEVQHISQIKCGRAEVIHESLFFGDRQAIDFPVSRWDWRIPARARTRTGSILHT